MQEVPGEEPAVLSRDPLARGADLQAVGAPLLWGHVQRWVMVQGRRDRQDNLNEIKLHWDET